MKMSKKLEAEHWHKPMSFDTFILPEKIRNYIDELSNYTATDKTLIVQSVLCTLSAVIGKRIYFDNYFDGQKLYPNIWCMTIADSQTFKTTALNLGSRIALKISSDLDQELEQLEQSDNKIEIIKNKKSNPIFSDKITIEAFVQLFKKEYGIEHNGSMIISTDLFVWLKKFDKSFNTGLKTNFLALFDVPELIKHSTKTGGTIILNRPYITINSVSTLNWIIQIGNLLFQKNKFNSFLRHFLFFYPPESENKIPPALPKKIGIDYAIESAVSDILNQIHKKEFFKSYALTQETVKAFQDYYSDIYRLVHGTMTFPHTNRHPIEFNTLKIACLFQPFENIESDVIELSVLKSAFEVVNYCFYSSMWLYDKEEEFDS